VSGTLPIANGGTNLTATPTDGQLLIGNTAGSGYTLATLTAGTNVSITNGAGSISIATSVAPSFATSVTAPIVYGGTSASASLTLQSTSGAGTTDSILFKVGNNGATTAMSIATGGTVTIGTLNLTNALGVGYGGTGLTTTPANGALLIGNGTNYTSATITAGTAISVTNGAGTITIANTGVTSNVAGTGISVSGATGAVTITNSGVTSIVAGTGITISGATGAVTISSSSGSNVSSISFGSTGLTPATATTGAVTVAGTLAVLNGGTGITSFGTGVATALGQNVSGSGSIVLGTSPTVNNPTVTNYIESVVAIGTVTTANTIALTNGTVQTATLTASTACTFTMPTNVAGKSFVLLLKQAATTGNGTATFTSVKWGTAGAPTITATAGKMDILTFIADGTNWYGSVAQGYTP
jgi:hypothetical protein